MPTVQQTTPTVNAIVYRYENGDRSQVDIRNVTGWTMERFYRFAKQCDYDGLEYEVHVKH